MVAKHRNTHPIPSAARRCSFMTGEFMLGTWYLRKDQIPKNQRTRNSTMRGWDLGIELDARSSLPLFLQIARAVTDGVRSGRLRPGEPLPGSRTLAATLRIHRNTALAAYRELEAEGWIVTSAARGTFVSSALPDRRPRAFAALPAREGTPAKTGFDLRPDPMPEAYLPPRGAVSLASGAPDARLFPAAAL